MPPDLRPAATRLGALVAGVPDDALANATPCPDYCLGDLLDHVGGLALAFTAAATKTFGEDGARPLRRRVPAGGRLARRASRAISRAWPRRGAPRRRGRG